MNDMDKMREAITTDVFQPTNNDEVYKRRFAARDARRKRNRELSVSILPKEDKTAIRNKVKALGITYIKVTSDRNKMIFSHTNNITPEIISQLESEFPEYTFDWQKHQGWGNYRRLIVKSKVAGSE